MGLRFAVSRAHGLTPYRVVFGRDPMLPSSLSVGSFDIEAALSVQDKGLAVEYVDALAVYMSEVS